MDQFHLNGKQMFGDRDLLIATFEKQDEAEHVVSLLNSRTVLVGAATEAINLIDDDVDNALDARIVLYSALRLGVGGGAVLDTQVFRQLYNIAVLAEDVVRLWRSPIGNVTGQEDPSFGAPMTRLHQNLAELYKQTGVETVADLRRSVATTQNETTSTD